MMSRLEIKAMAAGLVSSMAVLAATFAAGNIYRSHTETTLGDGILTPESMAARGRTFFFQSCAHCHGQDADGGEDAPSLRKLQISGAHMALVIESGIKGEMPSFGKKYNQRDTEALTAYLQTLH